MTSVRVLDLLLFQTNIPHSQNGILTIIYSGSSKFMYKPFPSELQAATFDLTQGDDILQTRLKQN